LGNETPFPERESLESAYKLSKEYRIKFMTLRKLKESLMLFLLQ
jgi:hypothetical protein